MRSSAGRSHGALRLHFLAMATFWLTPLSLLDAEARGFPKLWHASSTAEDEPEQFVPMDALPELSPDTLRVTSRTYAEHTATSVDGFHMRHYGSMSDQCLTVLSIMLTIMERPGLVPKQVQ
eukprot:9299937-Pyramimonas_sp.AAC.1